MMMLPLGRPMDSTNEAMIQPMAVEAVTVVLLLFGRRAFGRP